MRLNTNESPYPPPPEFVERWLDALRDVDWNRYPDRGATELRAALGAFLGQPPARLLCGNGSNEVLQTLLLTYGGTGRRALMFEPTYALHAQIARGTGDRGRRRRARAPTTRSTPTTRSRRSCAAREPSVVFVCSPNNPTGTVEPRETVERLLERRGRGAARCSSSTRRTASSRRGARSSSSTTTGRSSSCARIRRCGRSPAVRLGFAVAPTWMVAELEKVLLPYNLSVPTQVAGTVALEFRAEMEQRVASLVEERGRLFAALAATARHRRRARRARTSCLFRVDGDAHELWKRLLDARRARPRLLVVAAGRRAACASPSARPARTTRSSPRSARPCRRSWR